MKRYLVVTVIFVLFFTSVCIASDIKILKSESYELSLESITLQANSTYSIVYDIDSIEGKIPDQILSTVQTGDWISNLPNTVYVSDKEGNCDKITEYWDISFAKVNNGKIVLTRTITNNDSIDRNSYSWNILLTTKHLKYRH